MTNSAAPNPGPMPYAWESRSNLLLGMWMQSAPRRRLSASERATVLARAAQLRGSRPSRSRPAARPGRR